MGYKSVLSDTAFQSGEFADEAEVQENTGIGILLCFPEESEMGAKRN